MCFPSNILFLVVISHVIAGSSAYPAHYNDLEQYLLSRMNFVANPCDDFYTYACGNSADFTATIKTKNQQILKDGLNKFVSLKRDYPQTSAIGKALRLYEACVTENPTKEDVDDYTKENVNAFLENFNFPVDLFINDNAEVKIDREQFSEILKYVHDTFFVQPFFDLITDPSRWYDQPNPKNLGLFVVLPVTKSFGLSSYECNSPELLKTFVESVRNVIRVMGFVATEDQIEETAQKLMELEFRLLGTPCGNKNNTITLLKVYKWEEIESLTFENYGIDLNNYIRSLVVTGIGNRDVDIGIAIDSLREVLESTSDVDLLRYIYFRIVSKNAVEIDCIKVLTPMKLAKSRIYTEYKYASPEEREYFSDGMNFYDVIDIVKKNLRNMVLTMPFIQEDAEAYDKMVDKFATMSATVVIEDALLNNTWLDNYYDQIRFNDNDRFLDMYSKAQKFEMYIKVQNIIRDLDSIEEDMTAVNAFYSKPFNKFVINDGWLNAPVYDKNYDFSYNFGSVAGVVAHEIGHSVDADSLLLFHFKNSSLFQFAGMVDCVIDQYNKIQVLPNNYTRNHVNGEQTMSENMADISGAEAAFRSFEKLKRDGKLPKKPQLSHPELRGLTHDQLFFLGFANEFCWKQDYNLINFYIQSDGHSPNVARAESLTNIPAFGKAFNCPVGSKYRPTEYCRVWTH